jgi:hypothetical protein
VTASEVSSALADRRSVVRPVLVNRLFGRRVLNVVTAEWQQFGLSIVQSEDLARYNAAFLKPLFNSSGRRPPVKPKTPYRTAPEQLLPPEHDRFHAGGDASQPQARRLAMPERLVNPEPSRPTPAASQSYTNPRKD